MSSSRALKKETEYFDWALILNVYETLGKETETVIEFPWDLEFEEVDLVERPFA